MLNNEETYIEFEVNPLVSFSVDVLFMIPLRLVMIRSLMNGMEMNGEQRTFLCLLHSNQP